MFKKLFQFIVIFIGLFPHRSYGVVNDRGDIVYNRELTLREYDGILTKYYEDNKLVRVEFPDGEIWKGEFDENENFIAGVDGAEKLLVSANEMNKMDSYRDRELLATKKVLVRKYKNGLREEYENGKLVRIYFPDGDVWKGLFNGKKELLHGSKRSANGLFESGDYRKNKLVEGIKDYADNHREIGKYRNGVLVDGIRKLPNGTREAGKFKDGKLETGTRVSEDNSVEIGEFKDDNLLKGTKISKNGQIFYGTYSGDIFSGSSMSKE